MSKKHQAFTLLEMIIAITVFTVFIGFAISSYLVFHKADQKALLMRGLIMDGEFLMNTLSEAVRTNKIAYAAYESVRSGYYDPAISPCIYSGDESIFTSALCLISPDEKELYVYNLDLESNALYLQIYDEILSPVEGYEDPVLISPTNVLVTELSFNIFPKLNPFDSLNRLNTEVQFQPIVNIDLSLASGDEADSVSSDFRTSVTSRFYQ